MAKGVTKVFILGFIFVLIGAVLPFAMVIQLVESTFLLNFVAALSSVIGLVLGVIAAATHFASTRRDKD